MTCVRCGYCCTKLLVVIVVDPDKGPTYDNLKAINCLEEPCPHLRGDTPGGYSCSVHDRPWYKETPCYQYNLETPCRVGPYLMNNLVSS